LSVVDKILILREGVVEAFGPRAEILPRLGARTMAAPRAVANTQAKVVSLNQAVQPESDVEGAAN
jgi:ABC-type protease/lipase transport system fused ATPase/permease subunit